MEGVRFSEGNPQKEVDQRFYKTLDATYTQSLSWIESLSAIIKEYVRKIVHRLSIDELRQKTSHWKRGDFRSTDACILDTTEQTKMFMGKHHMNKKEIEKNYRVCIYIITCATLDERNKILVAPQNPSGRGCNLKEAFADIENRVTSIKRTTERNSAPLYDM